MCARCKRWERDFGLPVERLPGGPKAGAFAMRAQLDAWMKRSQDTRGTPGRPALRLLYWIAAAAAGALTLAGVFIHRWPQRAPSEDLMSVPLTSYPGIETSASFLPDGRKVVFVWDGEKQDRPHIYVKQIGGGTPVRLTAGTAAEYTPAWSPDDRWIAFVRQEQGRAALMLTPSVGGAERKLAELQDCGSISWKLCYSNLSWMPDAKWLGFVLMDKDTRLTSVWAISIAAGEQPAVDELSRPGLPS